MLKTTNVFQGNALIEFMVRIVKCLKILNLYGVFCPTEEIQCNLMSSCPEHEKYDGIGR